MQNEQTFQARVETIGGKCLVSLPFDPHETWGAKTRHYVAGEIDGKKIRGLLEPGVEGFGLALGAAWRRDNGVAPGDTILVVLWPEGPQSGGVAPDLAVALAAEPVAAAFFDGLATFYRKNFLRWIDGAKRPETRATRIRETVAMLKEGKRMS